MHDPTRLPDDLPVPEDDGAASHLRLSQIPAISLRSTDGSRVELSALDRAVLFFYPRTGIPDQRPSLGFHGETWESIPGARGCTPQSCGFRDLHARYASLGIKVFGVSTNTTDHQQEFKERVHAPFEFLSDSDLALTRALNLPTFEFPVESGGPTTLLRRMAWYIERAASTSPVRIRRLWYPVFPPDQNAANVATWLERRARTSIVPIDHSNPIHQAHIERTLLHHWHDTVIHSRWKPFNAAALPGYIAFHDAVPAGCLTFHQEGRELEVITLASDREGTGIGARLLETACIHAADSGFARLFLTTTNDNLHAQEFYQRQGLELIAIHPRAVDAARHVKPDLPRLAPNGLPIRDEWEYELRFEAPKPQDTAAPPQDRSGGAS